MMRHCKEIAQSSNGTVAELEHGTSAELEPLGSESPVDKLVQEHQV